MNATQENGYEISVTRYIAASPAQVWTVMTQRREEWFVPAPWTFEAVEQDWRPGGREASIFRGPGGETHASEGIFLEVTPGQRFVVTDAIRADWMPQNAFPISGWEIEAEGRGTRYRGWSRHWSAGALERHRQMGFEHGWMACADQLAELCEREAAVR